MTRLARALDMHRHLWRVIAEPDAHELIELRAWDPP